MSPHAAALRLAVRRPPQRAILPLGQFASAAASRPLLLSLSSRSPNPNSSSPSIICLRCTRTRRPFSTIPPPKPPTDSSVDNPQQPPFTYTQEEAPPTSTYSSASRPAAVDSEAETTTPPDSKEAEGPELPSRSEDRRHPLSARFSTFMDNLQSRVLDATQTINDLTGYSAIEAIKAQNNKLESDLAAAQSRLRAARHDYKSLTSHRAATQREVTTLLARKDTWNPTDLERFTTLYRLDHELESQVSAASAELTEAETEESKLSADLNAGILKRYHEEQIWSDRIRRQSTWGTWGLMGVNVLLFLVLQFVAEPWRRRRLMKHIAAGEKAVMDDVKRELAEVKAALEASGLRDQKQKMDEEADAVAAAMAVTAETETAEITDGAEIKETPVEEAVPWKERWKAALSDPEQIKAAVVDLYSERRIDLRMRDASLIALEGAAAGAAVVAGVALFVLRGSGSS
ncbi:Mdm33 family-domain-containing protein [Apodospora peruviana]|uniref:Sensitive to high expression protein 9, mitochondrial n=1 Tax=Apodospora peruviana TaxID=516989 RepID=A0AAE0M4L7_9PEZI|nr:Mdm33 family-domain-containing protein [Apodospora peruviana]